LLDLTCTSGPDVIELTLNPTATGASSGIFPKRLVNGTWPYLPKGTHRDSTLTVQGTTGRLSKNGAELLCEPGRMAYIQTEPVSGTYVGLNPFPERTAWQFSAPGGITVSADGRVGILRALVCPRENRVELEHAAYERGDPDAADATALIVRRAKPEPRVIFNGADVSATLERIEIAGAPAYAVPVKGGGLSDAELAALPERCGKALAALDRL
jgi:hypothetical protein